MKKIFLGLLMVPGIAFGMNKSVSELQQELQTAEARVAQGRSLSLLRTAVCFLAPYHVVAPVAFAAATGAAITAAAIPQVVPVIGFLAAPDTYGWLYSPASRVFAGYVGLKAVSEGIKLTDKLVEDPAYAKAVADKKRLSGEIVSVYNNDAGNEGMSYWLK